jgi:hypothetical protein
MRSSPRASPLSRISIFKWPSRKDLLDFMAAELGEDPRSPGSCLRFEHLIRFVEGHTTDRRHPALASIRGAFERLGLPWEERGAPFAMDAGAFRKASRTEVAGRAGGAEPARDGRIRRGDGADRHRLLRVGPAPVVLRRAENPAHVLTRGGGSAQ